MLYVQIYRSFNPLRMRKEWRWRVVHQNGNIMANSGEGYVRKVDCEASLRTVSDHMVNAVIDYPE